MFLGCSCASPPSPALKVASGLGGAAPEWKTIQHASVKQGGLQENDLGGVPRGTVTSISVRLPPGHVRKHLPSRPLLLMGISWEMQGQDQEVSGGQDQSWLWAH